MIAIIVHVLVYYLRMRYFIVYEYFITKPDSKLGGFVTAQHLICYLTYLDASNKMKIYFQAFFSYEYFRKH